MEITIPGVQTIERSRRLDIGIDRKKDSDHYYHEQCMESFSSASYSKWDDDRVWSSQEWKTDTEMYERSGQSKPMMNLIARTPSFVSSSTSVSPGRNITENKILGVLLQKIDQGNLIKKQRTFLQQIIQNWIMTVLGLLKSEKLRLRRTIDQGNLIKLLGECCNTFVLFTEKLFSTEPRNP